MSSYLKELEIKLKNNKKTDYETIDKLMKSIGKKYNVDMKTLHNDFVKKHNQSPDSWIKRIRGEKIKPTKECGCSVKEEFKKNLTPEQISKKHNISLNAIKKQLIKGIKVEKEHTNDTKIAEKIALQHLDEYPDYYTRLKKIETKKTFEEFILEASPAWQRKAGKDPHRGEAGSASENNANILASIIMRKFDKKYPEIFKLSHIN